MASTGVWRMWESKYFQEKVWPPFKAKYPIDAAKVEKVAKGLTSARPNAGFAMGIWEEMRLHAKTPTPPPPPPPPPPPTDPWDSGFPPQAYNQGSGGQNARYNIRINCTQRPDGKYVDRHNIVYGDGGLCDSGGRTERDVPGLKPADMMDGKEPWEPYEWLGKTIGPSRGDYPADSYNI